MNRLILIGNGFDLAHGFKTSFKDFIDDYFLRSVQKFYSESRFEDQLLKIGRKDGRDANGYNSELTLLNLYEKIENINKAPSLEFKIKSPLLNRIFTINGTKRWVDIEMEFFDEILDNLKTSDFDPLIKKTNEDLDFLREKLLTYLNTTTRPLELNETNSIFVSRFKEEISQIELSSMMSLKKIIPESLYFLNFNYTPTIERYLNEIGSMQYKHSYIHGSLSGNIKPVFGFGDEINKEYKEFEDQRNNELFKHIKSFHYSLNEEYFNLIRFIDSQEYQVSIFGHSCGLSDRTMLNQIFEHPNCKSIKIFYHKISITENDFLEKVYEIYRHFGNKGEARKKIVPFKISSPMPQNPVSL